MSADYDVAEAVNDLVRLIRDRLLIQTALALPQRWCLLLKRCPRELAHAHLLLACVRYCVQCVARSRFAMPMLRSCAHRARS